MSQRLVRQHGRNSVTTVKGSSLRSFEMYGNLKRKVVANFKYGYNMLANGDYFSTPNAVANQITGNITIIADCELTSWTPAAVNIIVAKDATTVGTRSYSFNLQTTGRLHFNWSVDGTNLLGVDATVATGFLPGTRHYVAVEHNTTTGDTTFFTSENGIVFKQLGAVVAGTAGAIFAGTAEVQFGNRATLSLVLDGKIRDSEIYSGLAVSTNTATMAVDFDPADWSTGTTWTAKDTGEVWTINGNAKIGP